MKNKKSDFLIAKEKGNLIKEGYKEFLAPTGRKLAKTFKKLNKQKYA